MSTSQKKVQVVVIGAGVSGLAAARALCRGQIETDSTLQKSKANLNVLMLEARDRIGGRCHTVQLPNGVPIDIGASFIHGCDPLNPSFHIAQQANVKVDTRSGGYSMGKKHY